MAEPRLSEDGNYYWDGRQWISAVSPDGRSRWNGYAWVPAGPMAPMAAPVYPHYQQAARVRVPTPWTKPMQYAVAAWYALSGLYAVSLPFWMSGISAQALNQGFQRQAQANQNFSPPPPELVSNLTSMMSGIFLAAAVIGVAICAFIVIGALMRWTWMFWAVLILLGLGAVGLPINLFSALGGSTYAGNFGLPSWAYWVSVAVGIPGAVLFVWMLVALVRYGPWAMTRSTQ